MFTEYEIETLVENKAIMDAAFELKKEFIMKEAPYLEISNEDFLALIVLAPTVGVALADDNVSFFEEMALNRKARKLSKGGGHFLKKAPVVFAMKYLIKKYDEWEDRFLGVIRLAMESSFDIKSMESDFDSNVEISISDYQRAILATPYIFVRFLVSFFLNEDDNVFGPRVMNKTDYERMVSIGKKLDLHKIPVFHYFCNTFEVK